MTARVGIVGRKRGTGIAVDDDGRERRAVALARLLMMAGMLVMPCTPCFRPVVGKDDRRGDRSQSENANPQSA